MFFLTLRYTIDYLVKEKKFQLVSVPDLLHPEIIRACGMSIDGERTQVFRLDPNVFDPVALSGTCRHVESLIGYAGVNMALNLQIHEQPKKSKLTFCFRPSNMW